jgi:hypothetical protein
MKTIKAPISEALLEVWKAKKAVYEETKSMTSREVVAYFEEGSRRFAEELGARWVENPDGTSSLV